MKVRGQKTEIVEFSAVDDNTRLNLGRNEVKKVEAFMYLGSKVAEDGSLVRELDHKIQSGWNYIGRGQRGLCVRGVELHCTTLF